MIDYNIIFHSFRRLTIPEEEQSEIFAEVSSELHKQELSKKKMKKKREFVKPKKSG